jgi:Cysteine-rich CPCC
MKYTCPCCGYLTRSEIDFSSHEICKVCEWEDDGLQLGNPACGGGANLKSLIDNQNEFIQKQNNNNKYTLDSSWRPFNNEEIKNSKE